MIKKRTLINISIVFLLLWGCEEVFRRKIGGFAGSYPYVESWVLNASEKELIEIIKKFKTENPETQPPNSNILIGDKSRYWRYIDFYYADTNEVVSTWIRQTSDSTKTKLAFYCLEPELNANNKSRKLINRDFWYLANKIEISKFKKNFVNPLKNMIEQNDL